MLLALVLISGSISLACGTEPAQTPAEQQPVSPAAPQLPEEPQDEQQPVSPTAPQSPEEAETPQPKPEITTSYIIYTDESNYFSISYPPDWEMALSNIGMDDEKLKNIIDNLQTDKPIESPSTIFFAGYRKADGFDPWLNIVVEKAFEDTVDIFVRSMMQATQSYFTGYREFSRVKTTVDGKDAIIVEWEGALEEQDRRHFVQMFMMIDGTVWTVTCKASPEDFARWRNDFYAIVRSFEISD